MADGPVVEQSFRADRMRELLLKRDPWHGRQTRLAYALGVTPQSVSDWLLGRGQPGAQLLVDLAAYLGTTADDLLPPTVRAAAGE